jgi:hypothetical protein
MPSESRPEERYSVDFTVFLSWQDKAGVIRRGSGRCVDLSASGIKLETQDRYEPQTSVLVQCDQFGRMGNASIRYCRRERMKYAVGLEFTAAFGLGDPVRRKILTGVLKRDAAQ